MPITDAQLNKALKTQTEEMAKNFVEATAQMTKGFIEATESLKKSVIEQTAVPMKNLSDLIGKTTAIVEGLERCLKIQIDKE